MILQSSTKLSTNYSLRLIYLVIGIILFIGLGKPSNAQITEGQKAISESALSLLGKKSLKFPGKSFPWDCSGVVLASLWLAGLDVSKEYGASSGNGVNRLHEIAVRHQIEYDLLLPEVGDIIFWDNTYDKNEDLLWNDLLTHTGIVVAVSNDGTITYVHHDYRRGIIAAEMNLFHADDRTAIQLGGAAKLINSPMRMDKDRYLNPSRWLSSHLFRSFGRFHMLLDDTEAKQSVALIPKPKH